MSNILNNRCVTKDFTHNIGLFIVRAPRRAVDSEKLLGRRAYTGTTCSTRQAHAQLVCFVVTYQYRFTVVVYNSSSLATCLSCLVFSEQSYRTTPNTTTLSGTSARYVAVRTASRGLLFYHDSDTVCRSLAGPSDNHGCVYSYHSSLCARYKSSLPQSYIPQERWRRGTPAFSNKIT